jgi:hypothetical protein
VNQKLLEKVEQANKAISDQSSNGRWQMCVPAQSDDSDILLTNVIEALVTLARSNEFALKQIAEQGCIDWRAYPDQQLPEAIAGIPAAECATFTSKPDVELCPACIAKQEMNMVGQDRFYNFEPRFNANKALAGQIPVEVSRD